MVTPTIDKAQEERLKVLQVKLEDKAFAEKFLACNTIEEAQKICEENSVAVTAEDIALVINSVKAILSDDDFAGISGGAETTGEKVKEWFKRHGAELGLGAAVAYEVVTSVVSVATRGKHDYSLHRGVGKLFRAVRRAKRNSCTGRYHNIGDGFDEL